MVGLKMWHESFDSIFYQYSVVGEDTYSMYTKIWREDIVVPYVTTYAIPLRMRTQTQTITKKRTGNTDSFVNIVICEEFSMRNA